MRLEGTSVGELWEDLLHHLYHDGRPVSPRNMGCREIIGVTLHLTDARNNIFAHPQRRLAYKFMIAEWLWIWFGHDDVATISRYNPNIAQFSDDNVTFFGAYGPRVIAQWPFILETLRKDRDSRQAALVIFRPNPPRSRDVPCTLTAQYLVRDGRVHSIYAMRSSDVWLGLEYDCFTFTMMQNILAAQLGVGVGSFTIHLGSSHLYDRDRELALGVLNAASDAREDLRSPALVEPPPVRLNGVLASRQNIWSPIDEPWLTYASVLLAETNAKALDLLRQLSSMEV